MLLSIRSSLTAGIAAGLVVAATGAAAVSAPAAPAALRSVASPAVELSAAIAPLLQPVAPAAASDPAPFVSANVGGVTGTAGDWIINAYNFVQPWVQYGVNLAAWAVSWLPWPIGLIGPQANILYSGWQPIGQSLAYSAAFLLDRQFDLIIPTLVNGVRTGISNLVQGEINWLLSFFPPLPPIPFPVPPRASMLARSAAVPPSSATPAATEQTAADATTEAPAATDPAPVVEAELTRREARAAARSAARADRKARMATTSAAVVAAAPAAASPVPEVTAPSEAAEASTPKAPKAFKAARSAAKAKADSARAARTAR